MFQFLRDIGMQVRPPLYNEETQETFNWVPIAVKTKRRFFQDLLVGFSVYPQNTNRTIQRLTLGTPYIRSPLPGYETHKLLTKLVRCSDLVSQEGLLT
jgi:hypothetical protein